jgi:hypothetical protein
MSNTILLIACIAAEGFLLYCLFHIAREIKSNRLRSEGDSWNEARSNIVPVNFVTPGSVTMWSSQLPEITSEHGESQRTSTVRGRLPSQTPLENSYRTFGTPSSVVETPNATADVTRQQKMQVVVIATTPESTIAALRSATGLSAELGAQITLVAMQRVPLQFPLRKPPVSVDSMQRRLYGLISEAEIVKTEVLIQLCLCRDLRDGLRTVLRTHSLVILGGPNHCWSRGER